MSANLVVDLGNTCDYRVSVCLGSGSNLVVGEIIDLLHANTNTQVFCAAAGPGSGAIQAQIQTSDSLASGTFTDPTSGLGPLNLLPNVVTSGGQVWFNSGLWGSGNFSLTSPVDSAPLFCSGGIQFAHFQRPHRYARLLNVSGFFPQSFALGLLANKKVTGSGGGFSFSPGSGSVNV